MKDLKKIILLITGFLFTALGIIGAVLPIMPSIPFFIIAAVCFSKSSVRFHNMLLNNKLIGPHVKNYHENNGIPLQAKAVLISGQWISIFVVSIFLVKNTLGRILLVIISVASTAYIASLKTLNDKPRIP